MRKTKRPKAFISYSWDNSAHKTWVGELADRLEHDGVLITLDQWDTAPGDELPHFMEKAIRENDFVLMICTPGYKLKYDERRGFVGYEVDLIQGEILIHGSKRKFIPILRKGQWKDVAPLALCGKYHIDLRDGIEEY